MQALYYFLDKFFLIFHALFTLFNVFGWIFKKTRKIHLITILLTAFNWFVLGIIYGWGFCYCTQWHWDVRDALGLPNDSRSYIRFLIHELTGVYFDPVFVDTCVVSVFLFVAIMSIILNTKDFIKYRKNKRNNNI